MLLYNITIKVDSSIHSAWLPWLQATHIPELKATGCFEKHQLVRLVELDETDGPTYALQLYVPNMEQYKHYMHQHAAALQQEQKAQWGDKMLCFATLMEVVD